MQILDFLLGYRDAREMSDPTHGFGIDGQQDLPPATKARPPSRERIAERLLRATHALHDSHHIAPPAGSADIAPMDAPNPSATPTFASRTPLHIAAVGLIVRDLDRLTTFYRDALGLSVLGDSDNGATLGTGGVPLVQLEHRPGAKPDDPREAGLYHTAFLMPTRCDLALWIRHVARRKVALTGASDHAVSEAFYLDDPEGNGIEVYYDRPPADLAMDRQ